MPPSLHHCQFVHSRVTTLIPFGTISSIKWQSWPILFSLLLKWLSRILTHFCLICLSSSIKMRDSDETARPHGQTGKTWSFALFWFLSTTVSIKLPIFISDSVRSRGSYLSVVSTFIITWKVSLLDNFVLRLSDNSWKCVLQLFIQFVVIWCHIVCYNQYRRWVLYCTNTKSISSNATFIVKWMIRKLRDGFVLWIFYSNLATTVA